jgi:hypothetical protein
MTSPSAIPAELQPFKMLNEREVAALAGVSVVTLRNWRSDPKRKHLSPLWHKQGVRVRYRTRDVLEWLSKGRVEVE